MIALPIAGDSRELVITIGVLHAHADAFEELTRSCLLRCYRRALPKSTGQRKTCVAQHGRPIMYRNGSTSSRRIFSSSSLGGGVCCTVPFMLSSKPVLSQTC